MILKQAHKELEYEKQLVKDKRVKTFAEKER